MESVTDEIILTKIKVVRKILFRIIAIGMSNLEQ